MLNGLALLPCLFIYGMLINEFKFIDIISLIQNSDVNFYGSNPSLMILNIIVMVGFILHYVSSYNLSYDFGKPGDKSKLKQLLVIIGAPLFITLFMITYLNGVTVAFGPKILIEVLFIIVGYVELHDIEKEAKDELERKGVLAKILPLARSNKGHYY